MGGFFSRLFGMTPDQPQTNQTTYSIEIKTCDGYAEGSTDSTVYIEMVGEDGNTTGRNKLDNFLNDDFERGKTDKFELVVDDVGLPILIRLSLEHWGRTDEWICDWVVVKVNGKEAVYPVYDWIEDKIEIGRAEASLPQKIDNVYLTDHRNNEITTSRVRFAWAPRSTNTQLGYGLPRFLAASSLEELPKIFMTDEIRNSARNDIRFEAKTNALLQTVGQLFSKLKDVEDYHKLYKRLEDENARNVLDGWDTDEWLGYYTMNGIAPLCFSRCSSLPDKFNVTNNDVAKLFNDGKTLEDEIQAGKIFISDMHALLTGVSRNKTPDGANIECPDAICMFHVNSDKKFVPIAIQLVPGDRDYLFTPADSKEDWMLAKMYYRCAIENTHQWIYHFLYTHGVMETVAITVFRDLPRCHPIYKLLRTHLRNVAAINTDARKVLIAPDGAANKALAVSASEMARKIYLTFHFDDLCIPKLVKKLGVDDTNILPEYYYRDDALELWKIMETFVAGIVNQYYENDQDIVDDSELQNWISDLANEGYGWCDKNTRGIPDHLHTREKLIEICTIIVFTSTAQHAAVNFGQFETYKFIPSSPGGMRLPAHKKGEGSNQRIMDSLPDMKMSQAYIVFSYVLSSYAPNEVYIGNFPERLFAEEQILNLQVAYKAELEAFGKKINKRNAEISRPYTYLLPDKIPNYIAI